MAVVRSGLSVFATVLAAALGCQQALMEVDSEGDQELSHSVAPGALGQACDACFYGGVCQWPVTACAGEPACARWLRCAEACPEVRFQADSPCVSACAAPQTARGQELRANLTSCVQSTPGCCASIGAGAAPTASGGSYEAPSTEVSDHRLPTSTPNATCAGETCEACMEQMKTANECLGDQPSCADTMYACYHEQLVEDQSPGHCWRFATLLATCGSGEQPPEKCGWSVPPTATDLTLRALDCVYAHCPPCEAGFPPGCAACRLEHCQDETRLLMTDDEAQKLLWCVQGCKSGEDLRTCQQQCLSAFGLGRETLEIYGACVQTACAKECEAET